MRRSRFPLLLVPALLVVGTVLTACSGDDEPDATAETASTGPTISITQQSAPLEVALKEVRSDLSAEEKRQVTDAAARPIESWFGGAYLGEYPRDDFAAGFEGWTAAAADLALRDQDTTSNAALGPDVVAVVADEQRADLYVFAEAGQAGGATADVTLRLTEQRESGELVKVAVTGSVYLTRTDAGWKIFGYDLSRKVLP